MGEISIAWPTKSVPWDAAPRPSSPTWVIPPKPAGIVEQTVAELGSVDILVNNAAYAMAGDRVPVVDSTTPSGTASSTSRSTAPTTPPKPPPKR